MIKAQDKKKLFQDTKVAFEKSGIRQYAISNNLKWNYSISATRLTYGGNLIVGFNWGVEDNYDYEPQLILPEDRFKDLYDKK